MQEVGHPEALDDLTGRLDGTRRVVLAAPDRRGIRAGFLSQRALTPVEQYDAFPDGLSPVQVNDDGETIDRLGRPAFRVRFRADGTSIDVVSVHLKSKLLTFPSGRFLPRDEGERARFAAYALHRRAVEAASVRAAVDELLAGDGRELAVIVAGTSTTSHRRRPRSSSSDLADPSTAPPDTTSPTRAAQHGYGTSHRSSRNRSGTRACTGDVASSSTTSSSATFSPRRWRRSPPGRGRRHRRLTTRTSGAMPRLRPSTCNRDHQPQTRT